MDSKLKKRPSKSGGMGADESKVAPDGDGTTGTTHSQNGKTDSSGSKPRRSTASAGETPDKSRSLGSFSMDPRPSSAGSVGSDTGTHSTTSDFDLEVEEDRLRLFSGPRRHGFEGRLDDNKMKQDHGIFYYENGDVYEGMWKDDKRHGRGRFFTLEGDVWDGTWKHDIFHDPKVP